MELLKAFFSTMDPVWLAVGLGGLAAIVVLLLWFRSRSKVAPKASKVAQPPPEIEEKPTVSAPVQTIPAPAVPKSEPPAPPTAKSLGDRLSRTRGAFLGRLSGFFGGRSASDLQAVEWQEIEEVLLGSDVGVATTAKLLGQMKDRLKSANGKGLKDLLREESEGLLAGLEHGGMDFSRGTKPWVVSIVGVNGVGKTTTIGKLASRFTSEGKTVLMAAGDTFRAAAIQQLKVWSERVGCQFVSGKEGGDPGAVAFDAVSAGKARGIDIVLLDTAGRLHTKSNLMDELKKVHRVVKKVIPEAPHETWIVVDGTNGQNAVHQVKEFHAALTLTGVIVTKLDGTAKGGAIFSIANDLRLPIRFIGVGEAIEDLLPFEPKAFVDAILN